MRDRIPKTPKSAKSRREAVDPTYLPHHPNIQTAESNINSFNKDKEGEGAPRKLDKQ